MTKTTWLGVDIAKRKFDVAVVWDGRKRAKVFANEPAGWRQLCEWLRALGLDQVHACLEATGRYGEGLALALHEAGHRVSLINPAQIKHFARTKLGRNKTDKLDAFLIAEYGRLFEPVAWTPPSPALRQLRDLVRTREALQTALTEWQNRREAGPLAPAADAAMLGIIDGLQRELAAVRDAIVAMMADDDDLRRQRDLLISIPGIGEATAASILSELPGPDVLRSARQAAAYAGLNPSQHRSGSSVDRPARISRIGNATLRAALYFPALAAMRFNPAVAALRARLRAQNRLKPMQIVAAAMRKLLHLCYGVLKTGRPFDRHDQAAAVRPA
jgi:transposase